MARPRILIRSLPFGAAVLALTLTPTRPFAAPTRDAGLDAADPACAGTLPLVWVDDAGAGRGALAEAQREASLIWDAAGIALTWSHAEPRRPLDGDALLVVVRPRIDPRPAAAHPEDSLHGRRRHTLGRVIRASVDRPGRLIELALADVATAVASQPILGRHFRDLPGASRDRVVGRGLGRVVAHEIGHWLFGRAHTPHGLMKASIKRHVLVDPIAPPLPRDWPAAALTQLRARRPCPPACPVRQPVPVTATVTVTEGDRSSCR
jgi:hypothetical protein